jgi:hypothetical protein
VEHGVVEAAGGVFQSAGCKNLAGDAKSLIGRTQLVLRVLALSRGHRRTDSVRIDS